MTVSEQQRRPPDNPPPGPEWKPIPGARHYEASHRGHVRSVDGRVINGKRHRGVVLKWRLNNSDPPYRITNIRNDAGEVVTVTVHSCVLRAHDREPEPGEECRHFGGGGSQDNRWPENICWGTKPENEADKAAARPPREPRPPVLCVNGDGNQAVPGGRRCHQCRIVLGHAAALLFEGGADPEQVAKALNYGSPNGAYRLAVQLGGMRIVLGHAESQPRGLRGVIIRWKAWLADSDAQ
jgi:hypothetical protein